MFDVLDVFSRMTLREKVAQMFLQYFRGYEDMPDKFKEMNRKNELGGFIFFSGNNVRDIEQLHRLTTKIQSHAMENAYNVPFMLTIDQEGGQLTAVFRGTTLFPGNMALGFANEEELAYQQGVHVGKELKYAGISICYAPVLDVDYDVRHGVHIVDNRRFSTDPEVVANMGTAYVKGVQEQGIIACGKHFPGMRITEVDTHFKVDRSPYDMERLESVEIKPFKKAIDNGLKCIMTHHGIFDALDPEYPASLSKKAMRYLREDLGFKGLIVTDDLIMKAVLNEYGEKEPVKLAINAGADLIITTCADDWFVDYVTECVEKGEIPMDRINDACLRILEYKKQNCVGEVVEEKAFDTVAGQNLSNHIAEHALVLYKGDPAKLPLRLDESKKVGVIFGNPARLVMSDATNLYDISIKDIWMKAGFHHNIKEAIMPWHPTDEEVISLADVGIISDVIVYSSVNCYRFERQVEILKEIRKYCPDKLLIAIASRSPMDVEILSQYADYVLVTGGITESLMHAVGACLFGDGHFTFNEAKDIKAWMR